MNKIIVAGAGHGGLSAAFNLAKNGYDVTVIEKRAREELGYDWKDSISTTVFEDSGFDFPDEKYIFDYEIKGFFNPKMNVKIAPPSDEKITSAVTLNRKFLVNYLIDNCISEGVKFCFNTEIKRSICDEFGVIGIEISGGKVFCDLVIDACGIDSPVRSTLNPKFRIQNNFKQKEVFCVYRACFERISDENTQPKANVTFYHCDHGGMDWLITEDDCIDILVGGFGSLTQEDVDKAINDYKEKFPYFSNKIISGGSFYKIPLRKMLPVIVCNGYAAIGDSASMIEPLSGSGVSFSMRAGKILADTVIESKDYSKKSLWKYNYDAFTVIGKNYLLDDIVRDLIYRMTAREVDYLFENKILSEKEMIDKANSKYSLSEIIEKATVLVKNPAVLKKLLYSVSKIAMISSVVKAMPEEYNVAEIDNWVKKYNSLP